jgi:hypothetical protein
MSSPTDEFTLYAKAERQLCDAAAPILGDLLSKIEVDLGVYITEVRVTVQRPARAGQPVTANCTIVSAETVDEREQTSSVRGDGRTDPPASGVKASSQSTAM